VNQRLVVNEGSSETPEDALTRARQRRDIQAAIDALEPEKRAVFVMFEMEGMSGQDIAAALGIPVGTVHSRLFAARKELTLTLAPHATKEASR
jgi:RNA polymerase sigma-70 factor (ECF subfamily)